MGATQQFSLRWNNYVQHITCAFDSLRCDEDLVDVTLSCEGKRIFAHKMLLSACSNYFKDVFKENPCKHPVIIFRNVKYEDLLAIIDFMYHGEVNVEQEQLSSFLTTAEMLAVQGLTVSTKDDPPVRKRPSSLLETNQPSPVQDLSYNRQSNTAKLSSRPLGTQNPPTAPAFVPPTSPRPATPVSKKRRLSPPAKAVSVEKEAIVRRRVPDPEPLIPKIEADDFDEESNFSEQEGLLDDSNLDLSRDMDAESPHVKVESSPPSEYIAEKIVGSEQLKPGPSAGIEAQGWGTKKCGKLPMWECEMCGKCFKHKDSRRQHYKSHEGSTECPICHNVLSRKYELKVHMRKRHNIDLFAGHQPNLPQMAEIEPDPL